MKFSIFGFLLASLICGNVFAQEAAITLGVQTTEVSISGESPKSVAGFYAGWLGFYDLKNSSLIRTGLFFSQRKYESVEQSFNANYGVELQAVEVPITYMIRLNEAIGVFAGLKLGINVSEECTVTGSQVGNVVCDADEESSYYGLNLGGSFLFHPNYFLELEYTHALSDLGKNTKWNNSLSIGLALIF